MIQIRYKDLGTPGFQHSLHKLRQSPMRTPAAFAIKHIIKALDKALLDFQKEAEDNLFGKFAISGKTPGQGEEVTGKSKELELPCQVKDGMEDEAKAAFEAFGEKRLEIGGKKIPPEVLFECNAWSPRELEALEPIVAEPPLE